jgi:DNA-binding beta-propeller fold protein YncE
MRSVAVPPTANGFTNLVHAYGLLETIAGDGIGRTDGVSYWQSWYEGGPAAAVSLSRPHYAMTDRAGNLYIADKNSHSVLRVSTDGTIHTHAGTHVGGFDGEGPAAATNLQLNLPNALWVRADGTVYVLDTENARVRRVTTNGVMSTLFNAKSDPSTGLGGGRCLWVKDDESLAYFGNTDRIRQWTPANGLQTLASGFTELGTFCVETNGNLIVADRGAHRIYRVFTDGSRVFLAGNGTTTGGGDGFPALQTGLNGPRGVWPVPTGGYLFLLHDGCRLWYMDSAATMHLLVNGASGVTHSGDGEFFYDPAAAKINEGRSVAMDDAGNILICESDYGFVRRIRFLRLPGH